MDGWTDGRALNQIDGWMEGGTEGRTDGRTDGWVSGWMDHCPSKRSSDRRTEELMDGQTDNHTHTQKPSFLITQNTFVLVALNNYKFSYIYLIGSSFTICSFRERGQRLSLVSDNETFSNI